MLAIRKGLQSDARGFTLVEVTIILLVLVILSTIMLPQLGNFNRLARYVVVKEDVGAICATLKKFLDEVMLSGPYQVPGGSTDAATLPTGLLVGPGQVPADGLPADTYNATDQVWTLDPDALDTFEVDTDGAVASTIEFTADRLFWHIQVNQPGGSANGGNPEDRYKNVIDDPSVGSFFGWRGPYFDNLTSDPWGTRYSVNTFGLHGGSQAYGGNGEADDVYMTPVICISFGPNKTADTEANMPGAWVGGPDYFIGGDDIAAVLSASGPF
jgi:type II secretory pathway pseudopilin PulG